MAFHTKILKNKILLASKLNRFSQASLGIDRNLDKHSPVSSRRSKWDFAGQASLEDADTEKHEKLLFSSAVGVPLMTDNLSSPVHEGQFRQTSDSPNKTDTRGPLVFSHHDKVDFTRILLPLDSVSHFVRPFSYTTDDITVRPFSTNGELNSDIIFYDNQLVTLLLKENQGSASSSSNHGKQDATKSCRKRLSTDVSDYVSTSVSRGKNSVGLHSARLRPSLRHSFSEGSLSVLSCTATDLSMSKGGSPSDNKDKEGPNFDQLKAVELHFIDKLPDFFRKPVDFTVYHKDVVFENNFWGQHTVSLGINKYAVELMKLRTWNNLKYAHVQMLVLSSNCVAEEGIVRVHWRIVGLPQLKALKFWKYTPWSYQKSRDDESDWIEGVSTFTVNSDGVVVKHFLDRTTPHEGAEIKDTTLATKLAVLLGLMAPKEGLTSLHSFL